MATHQEPQTTKQSKATTENFPAEGDLAPEFSALTDENQRITLADYQGQFVVLYFYPKDNTPGCTQEAKDFTEKQPYFAEKNAMILGVSRDNLQSHCRFKSNQQLNISLLVDEDEVICELYGVIKNKNRYGKIVRGIERSTFLINKQGRIARVWRNVKVAEHVNQVLKAIENIDNG